MYMIVYNLLYNSKQETKQKAICDLTIIKGLFLCPVCPVHDLSEVWMILWQTSVKNGYFNTITLKRIHVNIKHKFTCVYVFFLIF